jgi:2-oxoglutarate dehydrogenase E1 component
VLFTPKSLLRHPLCISAIADFTQGGFREVIDDATADPVKISKIVFCSGKIYYDILARRKESQTNHVALVRIEQLYPFPAALIGRVIKRYPSVTHYEWIQEEPANMGALNYILQNITEVKLDYAARPPSGSPATGSSQLHKIQQSLLVDKALGKCSCESANSSCRLHCAEK